jgi:hypothetical protein
VNADILLQPRSAKSGREQMQQREASFHSISSSAIASSVGGTSRRAFAVLRLMTVSNYRIEAGQSVLTVAKRMWLPRIIRGRDDSR